MEPSYTLSSPELFSLRADSGKPSRGARPDWFADPLQQKRGTGPLTAATLLSYLSCLRPELSDLYPAASQRRDDFMQLANEIWPHLPPGRLGACPLRAFGRGLRSFAAQRDCLLHTRELDIPRFRLARPTVSQCAAFLRAGLSADCPVAFLNHSKGRTPYLTRWHWVPIISLEQMPTGQLLCKILTGGKEREIDFRLWYQTTRAGGGLLYIPKETGL